MTRESTASPAPDPVGTTPQEDGTASDPTHGGPVVPDVTSAGSSTGDTADEAAGAESAGSSTGDTAAEAAGAANAGSTGADEAAGARGLGATTVSSAGTAGAAGDVPSGVTALTGEAATAPNGVQLNAFAVPVSAVPPSVLQGPTLSVPAPLPGQDPTPGTPRAAAPEPPNTGGWTPSGTRSPRTPTPAPASEAGLDQSAGPTGGAAERSSRREKDLGPEPASALTADRLLAGPDRAPVSGWRRWVYLATFGRVNPGDSDAVRAQRALEHRISVRLGGRTRYVPVLSRKGGVGKTTVTTLLGMALAEAREDRIIALDANPDRGTLSDRSPGRADHTARQLVQNRYTINSFAQLAGFVTRDGSRLHVLASDTDPAVAQAFDDSDYRAVTDLLSRYYSIVLTDSGTGMVHSVMRGTLEKADSVVLVSGGSVDEARLASETLSWLEAHGRQDLVAKAIVVINLSSGSGTQVDVAQIEQHFRSRVNTVVRIPYDRHLAEGSRVELARLNPATRRAVTELAALVVDQLAA